MSVLTSPATGEPPIQLANDIQILGATFAFLLGLAFGSFLNVVLARLPNNESIVTPASHCRNCTHTLSWWENIPVLSWLTLRGRCRQCQTRISTRYPLIELAVAILWAACWVHFGLQVFPTGITPNEIKSTTIHILTEQIGFAVLVWLLIVLASLDAEQFWLPDRLTLPGIILGTLFTTLHLATLSLPDESTKWRWAIPISLIQALFAAGIVIFIRLAYWLVRRKEGMGLGDAKLVAMLGAWLGFFIALETFAIAILAATTAAIIWLAVLAIRRNTKEWAKLPLPLGTFLCLAALPEIFYPNWLWTWYSRVFLP